MTTVLPVEERDITWVTRDGLKGAGWRALGRLQHKPGRLELDLDGLPTYQVWARWGVVTDTSDGFILIWEGDDVDKLTFKVGFWSERTPVRIVERHPPDPLAEAMQRLDALEMGMQRALFQAVDRVNARLAEDERQLRYGRTVLLYGSRA